MVALDSSGSQHPPRELAQQTVDQLRAALVARLRADADAEAQLGSALRCAAAEARERGLRPEELIIVLKSIGQQAEHSDGASLALPERRRILDKMVPVILKAYFE